MKKITLAVFTMILIITSVANADDAMEITDTFRQYVEAAVRSDGELAAGIFSDSAADYWDSMLKDALGLGRDELEKRPAYQLFNIILIRKRMEDAPEIAQMDGRRWLQHSYSNGWNSVKALNAFYENGDMFELVPEITGESAELKIKYDGEILPAGFPFVKERGSWKIDGEKQFYRLERNIEAKMEYSGMSRSAYVDLLFKGSFGHSVPERFWQPANEK